MSEDIPSPLCLQRLKKDIRNLHEERPPGIFIYADEGNIRLIHTLMVGPRNTPYHGAFFYLLLKIPKNYPSEPFEAKLMLTGGGRVRFNPNVWSCGTVCPGILRIWSAAQGLSNFLVSIQSLMNEKPFFLSDIFLRLRNPAGSDRHNEILEHSDLYNEVIKHETLRVAVCDMLEGQTADSTNFPNSLRDIKERLFLQFYDEYVATADRKLYLTGQPLKYPSMLLFYISGGVFDYFSILQRLHCIKTRLEAKLGNSKQHAKFMRAEKLAELETALCRHCI